MAAMTTAISAKPCAMTSPKTRRLRNSPSTTQRQRIVQQTSRTRLDTVHSPPSNRDQHTPSLTPYPSSLYNTSKKKRTT